MIVSTDLGTADSLSLGDAGGLRQIGLHLQVLAPGASTGERHWHSAEDEFLYLLEGEAVLHDDAGATKLHPGDAVGFRHGEPNGHAMSNRGDVPCRWLMLGSRARGDICHYVETGRRQVNAGTTWHIEDAAGERLKGGDLPGHLLGLLPPWGSAHDGQSLPRVIRADTPATEAPEAAHPVLGTGLGPYAYRLLSDPAGLTQFGAFVEILPPGSLSSFRHWHEAEDEAVFCLSGEVVLIEETETRMTPGMAAVWAAGRPTGHCLANRSAAPASYLVIGTRHAQDRIHYPDHDLITEKSGPARRYFHADGSPR